jgi:hypothetical protein
MCYSVTPLFDSIVEMTVKDAPKQRIRSRSVELTPGRGRTTLKFDASTWAAIDLVAERKRIDWQDWARQAVAADPGANNKSRTIRAALTDELLGEIAEEPAEHPAPEILHPMLAGYHVVGEPEFFPELTAARIVYAVDLGGFVLHAGFRSHDFGDQPALFIENKIRGGLSVVLTEPETNNQKTTMPHDFDNPIAAIDMEIGTSIDDVNAELDKTLGTSIEDITIELEKTIGTSIDDLIAEPKPTNKKAGPN